MSCNNEEGVIKLKSVIIFNGRHFKSSFADEQYLQEVELKG